MINITKLTFNTLLGTEGSVNKIRENKLEGIKVN